MKNIFERLRRRPSKLGWSRMPSAVRCVVYAGIIFLVPVIVAVFDIIRRAQSVRADVAAESMISIAAEILVIVAAVGVWMERRFPRALVTVAPFAGRALSLFVYEATPRDWLQTAAITLILWCAFYFDDQVHDYYVILREAAYRQADQPAPSGV